MSRYKRSLFICFCFILFSSSLVAFAEVVVEKAEGPYGTEIILKNEFISVSIVPEWGGRIKNLIDKKTGADLVFWDYPPDHPQWRNGLGGALDDRYGLDLPYDYTITESPDKASINLQAYIQKKELMINKKITLASKASLLEIEYTYSNYGQNELKDYELMIRNFFWPGGGPVDWQTQSAFVPSIKSVRELGETVTHRELNTKFQTEIIPTWTGFIDKKNKRGLAFAFQDDYYRWFYRWVKGDSPTYEWVFSPLPPGKEVTTRFTIGITHGLDSYIDISEWYAASLDLRRSNNNVAVTYKIYPTKDDLDNCVIKTTLLNLDREVIAELPDIKIGEAKVGEAAGAQVVWEFPHKEAILIQKVYNGQNVLGEYEIPVPLLTPPANYQREKRGRQEAVIQDIPGWSPKTQAVSVKPSAKDYERGYMVYLDYFALNDKQRGIDINNIPLTLGRDEFESIAVKIRSFEEPIKFQVISDNPRVSIKVQVDEELEGLRSGFDSLIGKRLISQNTFTTEAGKDSKIWFIWDGRGLEPGLYTPVITFIPENGQPKNIVLAFNIVDIKVPDRNILEFETEGYIFRTFGRMYNWDLDLVKLYIKDLGEHRVNVASIFNGIENGFLREMQVKPLFKDGKMEPGNRLDLSSLDPWFDELIQNGLIRAYVRQNGLDERTEVQKWRMEEAARYLAERGYPYRERYVKFVDEMPAEYYPRMAEIGKMYQELGWRVMHTTLPIKSAVQMSVLNESTDIWHGPIPQPEDVKARLEEGNLDLEDELWNYKGWGAVWSSYASRRSYPWLASGYGLNGVHLHVYYRGSMNEAIIFPTPSGPDGSAAWEGIRDGIEDVQYLELAKQWVENLKANGYQDEKILEIDQKLKEMKGRLIGVQQDGYNYPELIDLKQKSLAILEELKQYKDQIKVSVYYGFDELVVDDDAQFALLGNENAIELIKMEFSTYTRADLKVSNEILNTNMILPVTKDSEICKEFIESSVIDVTPTYPAVGSYSIYRIKNPVDTSKWILLIVGGDDQGLLKGCNNFFKFLRVTPQMF